LKYHTEDNKMRFHRKGRRSRPSLTKFRWKMFVAINKLNIPFAEQEAEKAKLKKLGTLYRLPQTSKQKLVQEGPRPLIDDWW